MPRLHYSGAQLSGLNRIALCQMLPRRPDDWPGTVDLPRLAARHGMVYKRSN